MPYLYRYETKGIQAWLLDAGRLRDLEGGSAFIDDIARKARSDCEALNADVIQAAAGGLTAIFPDLASLESFAATWPAKLYYEMPDLAVVQAWVAFQGSEPGQSNFDALYAKLKERRNRVWPALPEAGPVVARAARTGRPAIVLPKDLARSNRGLLVDAATARRQQAREGRDASTLTLGERRFCLNANGETWKRDGDVGTIAVLHADATGVGQRITQMANRGLSTKDFKAFSSALADAMEGAVGDGLAALPTAHDGRVAANLIVLGGDDVTLLLPAAHSMRFIDALMQSFARATGEHAESLGGALALGVGVCFVHPHHPFYRAYELAETDCATAKRDVRKADNEAKEEKEVKDSPLSGVRFRRVTTSLDEADAPMAHTWTSGDISKLETLVDAMRRLPRGSLRTFLTPVEAGDGEAAKKLWGRIAEVQREERKHDWEAFCEALRRCHASPDTGLFLDPGQDAPGADGGPPLRSPLFDALALDHLDAFGLRAADKARAENAANHD